MCSKDSLHVDTISMLYLDKLYSNDFKSLSLRNVQPCSLKADRLSNKNITYLLQFLSCVIFTQRTFFAFSMTSIIIRVELFWKLAISIT